MQTSLIRTLSLLVLVPYIAGFTPDDTLYTDIAFGLGTGQYRYSDCSGSYRQSFHDIGVKATHKENQLRVGLSAGLISHNRSITGFAFPDLAYDPGTFSIGTTGLRIGRENYLYGEVSIADQIPFYSGKGFARTGIGWSIRSWDSRFWIGRNVFPYDVGGWAGQIEFPLATNNYIFVNGRVGKSYGVTENGVSIGLRLRK